MGRLPSLRSFCEFGANINWTYCSFTCARELHPNPAWLYLIFLICCLLCCSKMWFSLSCRHSVSMSNVFIFITVLVVRLSYAQSPDKDTTSIQSAGAATGAAPLPTHASVEVIEISGTTTTFRPIFTVPTEADTGAPLLPNINDANATDAQTVCPGYTATNVKRTDYGLTATLSLAGPACNVYGTDITTLNLSVEYQSSDRLAVRVVPANVDASNSSQYILPTTLVHQPTIDADADMSSLISDLNFVWSNDPTFSFSVYRKSTGDVLLSTEGTKLVYENQFIEFASALPENYNLYGLGETIHGLRLGNSRCFQVTCCLLPSCG